MDKTYTNLADRAITKHKSIQTPSLDSSPKRLLIAVAGPPGSGKTTIANHVAVRINSTLQDPHAALAISIDGFHLPRSALDLLPNSEEAYVRRGAHWTFDAAAAVAFVRRARNARGMLYAPTFDHAVKDPVANGLCIPEESQVLIFEGLYLLCDLEPWSLIGGLVDEKWFVEVDADIARRRVAERHVQAGIEGTLEEGLRRVDTNDAINGRWICERRGNVDAVIQSLEEEGVESI